MDEQKESGQIIKSIILGLTGVGKQSILNKLSGLNTPGQDKGSLGIQYFNLKLESGEIVQVWNSKSEEPSGLVNELYFTGTQIFILIFDVTRRSTFDAVGQYAEKINAKSSHVASQRHEVLLLGNKNDLEAERVVSVDEAEQFAILNKMSYLDANTTSTPPSTFISKIKDLVDILKLNE